MASSSNQENNQKIITSDYDLGSSNSDQEINFKELLKSLNRRKKLIFFTFMMVFSAFCVVTTYKRIYNPIYSGSFTLLIKDPINTSDGNSSDSRDINNSFFESIAANQTSADIPTLISYLKSNLLLNDLAKENNLTASQLSSWINIKTGYEEGKKAVGILKIYLTINDLKLGTKLLTELNQLYLEAALKQKQQRLNDGINFLNQQEPSIKAKTSLLKNQLAEFREKNNLLDPTKEGLSIKTSQNDIQGELLELNARKNELISIREKISNKTITARGFKQDSMGLLFSDFDQSLLEEQLKLENELAKAKSIYKINSTVVKGLESSLNRIKPELLTKQLEAVDLAISLTEDQIRLKYEQKSDIEEQFLKQPQLIKEYLNIQEKLASSQNNLLGLASAKERFQLQMAQETIPWKTLVKPSMKSTPIRPAIKRDLTFGLLISIIFSFVVALVRDKLDNVFHSTQEVKETTNSPILTHIPYIKDFSKVREEKIKIIDFLDKDIDEYEDKDKAKETRYQRFFYQEAFRNLFSSIKFLNSDKPLQSVIITSSNPAEGKSLVNVVFAKTLADLGQNVLLIDADLRKPQVHFRLGLNNLIGLSNLLTDNTLKLEDVIQDVPNYSNWKVITSGVKPPDPTRLLSSDRMQKICSDLVELNKFDLILFDAPPILGLADSPLISKYTDGVILLVTIGMVDKSLPLESISRIKSSGSSLLGVITNSIKEEKIRGQGYGYGGYYYSEYIDEDSTNQLTSDTEEEEIGEDLSLPNSKFNNLKNKLFEKIKVGLENLLNWIES